MRFTGNLPHVMLRHRFGHESVAGLKFKDERQHSRYSHVQCRFDDRRPVVQSKQATSDSIVEVEVELLPPFLHLRLHL